MTGIAGRYKQDPDERKRYVIDFTQWLDSTEVLTTAVYEVSPVTTPELVIDGSYIADGNLAAVFYVSGGKDGEKYKVLGRITTSTGQIYEASVLFTIKAN